MIAFDSLPDFDHRSAAAQLDALALGVHLQGTLQPAQRDTFAFPGQHASTQIWRADQQLGHVDFSLNPLGDRLYIDMIEVDADHRRSGLGLAVLWHLWRQHQVPIVPIQPRGTSTAFWTAARQRLTSAGAVLEAPLFDSELDGAKQRWAHLVPESDMQRAHRRYWAWVEAELAAGRPAGPGIR